eukprot:464897-Pelagomonas_calceolata.AAC.5
MMTVGLRWSRARARNRKGRGWAFVKRSNEEGQGGTPKAPLSLFFPVCLAFESPRVMGGHGRISIDSTGNIGPLWVSPLEPTQTCMQSARTQAVDIKAAPLLQLQLIAAGRVWPSAEVAAGAQPNLASACGRARCTHPQEQCGC